MTLTEIRTLTVFVTDQERAKAFYTDVLGFTVRADQRVGDNRWLEVSPAGSATTIVLHRPFPGAKPGSSDGVILTSTDLDADVAAIRDAGGSAEGPETLPWGRQALIRDPDGNGFVLAEAA